MFDSSDVLAFLGIAAIVALVVIGGPLAIIWALNTLFGFGIGFTFKTWLAAFILGGVVSTPGSSSRKGK
jgi:hypothetical protein